MLYLIMGASGSGKSSALSGLKQHRPDIDWRDFDDAPKQPTNTAERQETTEYWLQVVAQNQIGGISTGIAGTTVFGEVLACPSAIAVEGVQGILLDCTDVVRIDRIRGRDGLDANHASQEMLCWAAWLRMHASDPQWRQDVIQSSGALDMVWERWSSWEKGDPGWRVGLLDNSYLTIEETTRELLLWISERESDGSLHDPRDETSVE